MTQPYREPESVSIPLTDDEVSFWDRAACAAMSRPDSDTDYAAKVADRLVNLRRARFGVRGLTPPIGTRNEGSNG